MMPMAPQPGQQQMLASQVSWTGDDGATAAATSWQKAVTIAPQAEKNPEGPEAQVSEGQEKDCQNGHAGQD